MPPERGTKHTRTVRVRVDAREVVDGQGAADGVQAEGVQPAAPQFDQAALMQMIPPQQIPPQQIPPQQIPPQQIPPQQIPPQVPVQGVPGQQFPQGLQQPPPPPPLPVYRVYDERFYILTTQMRNMDMEHFGGTVDTTVAHDWKLGLQRKLEIIECPPEVSLRCHVVTYHKLGDLVEKAAEQEAGLAEEQKLLKSAQPKSGKNAESQKKTGDQPERPKSQKVIATPSAQVAPTATVVASGACFTCGQHGHFSRNCPTNGSAAKRQAVAPCVYALGEATGAEPTANVEVVPSVDVEVVPSVDVEVVPSVDVEVVPSVDVEVVPSVDVEVVPSVDVEVVPSVDVEVVPSVDVEVVPSVDVEVVPSVDVEVVPSVDVEVVPSVDVEVVPSVDVEVVPSVDVEVVPYVDVEVVQSVDVEVLPSVDVEVLVSIDYEVG
ncbi:hypothetical protein F2Q69_00017918 [Brassica cretica]|uniref:CCHC-type domain-containing protein n=1 Tax=Brassica cretica TaxID=69181 RepID=A0A8S9R7K3_BRACR|nr:hypothetical protein F2Q69_00017918 [Brassica cretica]